MTDYRARADYWADKYGVDPAIFAKLVNTESGWNPDAVSPTGAIGLTQALPSTARDPGFGVDPLMDINNPDDQLRFGAQYLAAMKKRYGGNMNRALLAYNQGAGVADQWQGGDMSGLPAEGRNYVHAIMGGGDGGGGGSDYSTGVPVEKAYEPDRFDKLYSSIQSSDMGKALGLQEGAFHKDSQGRNILAGIMTGLGSLA